jgi:ribulose-5-phosphate 4-epimerase/fuculose-1-phosphate aldolase
MTMTTGQKPSIYYPDLISRAVRIGVLANVLDTNGHISARDETDPNVMWINNRHASRSTMTPAGVVPFDIRAGKRIGEGIEPPAEWYIHAEVYKLRPDVNSVMHSHPRHMRILSTAGHVLRPVDAQGRDIPGEGAPVFDTPVQINSTERGFAMAKALGNSSILVLRQHGAVVVGASVEITVTRMISCEDNAMIQFGALQVGTPRYLHGEELKNMVADATDKHVAKKYWTYWEETARSAGAFAGL